MLGLFISITLSAIPFFAWAKAMSMRDDMKRERDAAVGEASRYRRLAGTSYQAAILANNLRERAERAAEFLADSRKPDVPEKERRALKTLQAELADARRVLSENGLLAETHRGGRA